MGDIADSYIDRILDMKEPAGYFKQTKRRNNFMENRNTSVVTGKVRISYEHLLKPYANQQGAEPKYSCTLLIPKSDIVTKTAIDNAIREAIEAGVAGKWNGVRPPQPPIPMHDGDGLRQSGEAFGEECRGCWVMTSSSKQIQDVVDLNMQPILDATAVYSGMYARVSINFFAYNSNGKKGIGCGLGPVQKLSDGEPLGGRISAADAFGSAPAPAAQQQYAVPAPGYPAQAPQYAAPQQYAAPAPAVAPGYPAYAPQAPQQQYPAQPQGYPQQYTAVDPITGQPV